MPCVFSAFADEAGDSCEQQIAALKRGGMNYIDLRGIDGYNITELPVEQAKTVKTKLDDAGIKVNMYGSPIGKIDIADDLQIDLDKLSHLAKMRDVFGATAVRIFSYYNKKNNQPKDVWQAESLRRLEALARHAGQLGLVLYHENESGIFGDAGDDVQVLAQLRDGKTFKLIYDFANYIRTGEDGYDTWQKCKDNTDCFHFKDQKKSGEHVPMGQGDTDAEKIVTEAVTAGFDGPVVLEPHLRHSAAVLATHASGQGMQALKDMPQEDVFQVAVEGAIKFMDACGMKWE